MFEDCYNIGEIYLKVWILSVIFYFQNLSEKAWNLAIEIDGFDGNINVEHYSKIFYQNVTIYSQLLTKAKKSNSHTIR